jgi:predicted ATPase
MQQLSREGGDNCERIGILYFGAICRAYQTWSQASRSKPADFIDDFRANLRDYEAMGCGLQLGLFHSMLARLLLAAGDGAEAAKAAETALAKVAANGERWWAPELHRILGDALLALTRPDDVEAENCYRRAIDEARRTGALMLELRAATSLASLLARRGDRRQAHDILAPVAARLREGYDSADLRAATALLNG